MLTKLRFLGIIWRYCCAICTVTEVFVPWSFLSILIVTKTKVLMLISSIHLACPYNHYLPARFISIWNISPGMHNRVRKGLPKPGSTESCFLLLPGRCVCSCRPDESRRAPGLLPVNRDDQTLTTLFVSSTQSTCLSVFITESES